VESLGSTSRKKAAPTSIGVLRRKVHVVLVIYCRFLGRHDRIHMPFAGQRDEHVAAFMDQQLAVDAPVALPCETPYPFTALATVRSPVKALGLEEMAVGAVQLPPSSGSAAVDGFSDHLRTENRTPAPRSSPTPEDPGAVSWARQHQPCHPDSATTLSSTPTRGQDWQGHTEWEQPCGARCREQVPGLRPPASRPRSPPAGSSAD